jgi:DNA repair protein RAD5
MRHDKVVVVSRFTSYFEVSIKPAIRNDRAFDGIVVSTFTGKISHSERQVVLDKFANDPSNRILLLSLKAGGLGLNLVSASMLVLCDQVLPFAFYPAFFGLVLTCVCVCVCAPMCLFWG